MDAVYSEAGEVLVALGGPAVCVMKTDCSVARTRVASTPGEPLGTSVGTACGRGVVVDISGRKPEGMGKAVHVEVGV